AGRGGRGGGRAGGAGGGGRAGARAENRGGGGGGPAALGDDRGARRAGIDREGADQPREHAPGPDADEIAVDIGRLAGPRRERAGGRRRLHHDGDRHDEG